jgi:hypothetical protein
MIIKGSREWAFNLMWEHTGIKRLFITGNIYGGLQPGKACKI